MSVFENAFTRMETKQANIGIIGLGYVGLPLMLAFCKAGYKVTGFDIDAEKARTLNSGESYLKHIPSDLISSVVEAGLFSATADFTKARETDALIICVPTPLTRHREPDLSYVERTLQTLAPHLRQGHLVALESTTYPGTSDEIIRPILEAGGFEVGEDIFLAYSPEREDPGNPDFSTNTIPKVMGANDDNSRKLAEMMYASTVSEVVTVSSLATAEAVKLTENIFRAVNIALVNELKVVFEKMDVDIWEVVEAAKTKPFGYMPFYPGPGLGGHCIPIDPFYLTWKAREHEISTRFIELAGEVNTSMPLYVIERLVMGLDQKVGKSLSRAKVLVVGVAYKSDLDDMRESPSLKILKMLRERGADVSYHDPYIAEIGPTREFRDLMGMRHEDLPDVPAGQYDAALILTDHQVVDYQKLLDASHVVIDTRNAIAKRDLDLSKVVAA